MVRRSPGILLHGLHHVSRIMRILSLQSQPRHIILRALSPCFSTAAWPLSPITTMPLHCCDTQPFWSLRSVCYNNRPCGVKHEIRVRMTSRLQPVMARTSRQDRGRGSWFDAEAEPPRHCTFFRGKARQCTSSPRQGKCTLFETSDILWYSF